MQTQHHRIRLLNCTRIDSNQWPLIKSQSPHPKVHPASRVPTISTSLMRQKKPVLICPIHAELAPAPRARARFQVVLLINRIRASWTMNRSPKASPFSAWLTQQAIARSRVKQKKTSDFIWAEHGGAVSLSPQSQAQDLALRIADRPKKKSWHSMPGTPSLMTRTRSGKMRKHLCVRLALLLLVEDRQTLFPFFFTSSIPFTSATT